MAAMIPVYRLERSVSAAGTQILIRRAVPAHDPDRQAGGDGGAGDDAGALPALPAHPDLRAARLARPPGVRPRPRHSTHGRRHRAPAAQLRRGRPHARRRVPGRPDRRPVHRRDGRRLMGTARPSPASSARCPSPSAAASPAAGCARPARRKPSGSFSPFVFFSLHRHVWRMVRRLEVNWQVVLLLGAGRPGTAPAGARRALRRAPPVLPRTADSLWLHGARRTSRRCCASRRRSRSGTTRASSTGCRSRRSCCWRPRSRRSRARSTRTSSSTR